MFENLPQFSTIDPTTIIDRLKTQLDKNRHGITEALTVAPPTWQSLMLPLESLDDELNHFWSPISHLHSVVSTEPLRKAYQACLPLLSDYATEVGQNKSLFEAIKTLSNSEEAQQFDVGQKKLLENELRDFELSGVALSEDKQKRFKKIQQRLSELSNQFAEHVLDATQAWTYLITDKALLSGLPEHAITAGAECAKAKQEQGWLFTLDFPSYHAIMTYADSTQLRELFYTAFSTRASDQGPHAGRWDNTELMEEIVTLRHTLARLLDFKQYAERSLAKKMAKSTKQVMTFLMDLVSRCKEQARREFIELATFAREAYGQLELKAWDMGYYSEKLRQSLYAISQEDLRPYFPEDRVLQGLFDIIHRLYGISIEEVSDVDTWDPSVRFFILKDNAGELRGGLYMDLYARSKKRGGAWMDECQIRRRLPNGDIQLPIAFLTCNFSGPTGDKPALFTHDEVTTLFHECGHCLHHLLTTVDYAGVSGINGVPWDAVELPSQFFENWCWQKEALDLCAQHVETGESLPDDLFEKLYKAKNFQAAMGMLRQLEFSLFDFRLHAEFDPKKGARVQELLNDVRSKVAVVPVPEFNRFQHGFSHIFAGGYAAGYYSYKWAEVLSSDAFGAFRENGLFDKATGDAFLHTILEKGGTQDAMDLFVAFRGREPTIDALLKDNGIR